MEKNNKKKLVVSIIAAIILVIGLIGLSYAFFDYVREGVANNFIATGNIFFDFVEENKLTLVNQFPQTDEEGKTNDYLHFKVFGKKSTSDNPIYYKVYAQPGEVVYTDSNGNIVESDATGAIQRNRMANENIKLFIEVDPDYQTEHGEVSEVYGSQTGGIITDDIDVGNGLLIATGSLPATNNKVVHHYRLTIWVADSVTISDTEEATYRASIITSDTPDDEKVNTNQVYSTMYYSIKINVVASNEEIVEPKTINQIVKTDQLDTGIKFYEISSPTNGEGLYMLSSTANDKYPIYYYRGNVENNNIYFAENCWKIVRTTETGGLKLIYNGEATVVDGKKQCLQTTGTGTQLPTTTKFNSSIYSPAYVGYGLPVANSIYTRSRIYFSSGASEVYYGSSINPTTYELVDPQTTLDNNHHYSYNSTDIHATGISGDTGNVRYYFLNYEYGYYITYPKTKSIQTVLNEMLAEPISKENPSTIQGVINTWWSSYDATYGKFLEDTEWCNDRSIGDLGGWNPNGGDLAKELYFTSRVRYDQSSFGSNTNNIKNTNQPVLTCSNANDKLSVANGSLTYKIGLLTYDEVAMAGATWNANNSNFYLYTTYTCWLLSPSCFGEAAYATTLDIGILGGRYVDVAFGEGVRPSLSLKLGTEILGGDGTATNPYIVTNN